ncbi:MAG: sigma-54 dependent transcriptional regulator [Myxococcota bacterium]|jgi:two-component system response regulator AtoC|nr:sigma-54 dependent transcriptional regulator [Myxococcota bacterium]
MPQRILIVDDDDALRESLELILASEGYAVTTACDGNQALTRVEEVPIDIVLCDVRMPGLDGFELLPQIARRLPGVPVVMMSAYGSEDLAIEAMKLGAYDYVAKPFQPPEVLLTLRKAMERERLRRANEHLQRDVERAIGERPIVAASPTMIDLLELVERTAAFKTTALLTGESGTGKEVLARAIHSQSPRRAEPFIAVNCGAIPEPLLESELFGHAKGAFTGANRARRGLFPEADGGTLFLDEIAELPQALQVKLLRVLQEEEVRPVGENKPVEIDVRVIAATSRDLETEIAEGRFREDLFYRLNVMHLEIPALRERREDIPLLCDHFLAHFRDSLGKSVRSIADNALDRLIHYEWPGNVRELQNVIERSVILADTERLQLEDLPSNIVEVSTVGESSDSRLFAMKPARRRFEIDLIRRALKETDGNRTHAAKLLEISHRALLYKLKEYGIRD